MLRKIYQAQVKTTKDGSAATRYEAIISTGDQDRDGEFLEPTGARLSKGAPLLYGHDYGSLRSNIGGIDSMRVEGNNVIISGEFDDDIPEHTDAIIAAGKARKGSLKTLSAGFIPKVARRADGQVITLGRGEWIYSEVGTRYAEWDLVEGSFVPVPSNDGSLLISARGLHGPQAKQMQAFLKSVLEELLVDDEFLDRLKAARAGAKTSLAPGTVPAAAVDELDALLAGEEPAAVAATSADPEALAATLAGAAGEDLDELFEEAAS